MQAISECVFKSAKLIVDNKISADAIKQYLKTKIDQASPEWQEIIEMSIDKCVGEAEAQEENLKKKLQAAPYNIKDMNPIYAFVGNCISNEIFLGCPTDSQNADPSCKVLIDYAKKCGNKFPPAFMHD